MPRLRFILLFALAGCDTYGVGSGDYGYGGAPTHYFGGGDYGSGYTPYYERERERPERRWQNQGGREQGQYNAPPPRQAPPPLPPPPSAGQNRKALENLGFRPNQ